MASDHERDRLTFIGRTNFRGVRRLFGIRRADRRSHLLVLGKTGTGKSTLLEMLIRQDIQNGEGLALLDPHGDLVERVVARVPESRRDDLIHFNVPDAEHLLAFNPLESVAPAQRPLVASGVLEVFKNLWTEFWGPRLEHILRNALLALMDQPLATLPDILRLLHEKEYRVQAMALVSNPHVRRFWLQEYEGYLARLRAEAIAPIQNKIGAFLSDPRLARIFSQPQSSFALREAMDQGRILLVNLAKGKIGEDTARLLGSLLVSKIGTTALTRADLPEEKRRDFYLYLDEFQTFTTLSLATMLSELRKHRGNLTIANQYLAQLHPAIRDAVVGNVGTMIVFRLGAEDALVLEREFGPEFRAEDLVNLPNYEIAIRLMVDGKTARPFSGETIFLEDQLPDGQRPGRT